MLRFDGHFVLSRPLAELATVFDMTGLALSVQGAELRSDEHDLTIRIDGKSGDRYRIAGTVAAPRADALLQRLAAALEADGIVYRFVLYDAAGHPSSVIEHG